MNASQLSEMPVKQLKEYVKMYGLRADGFVEKSEFADLIVNTPLREENEQHFRSLVDTHAKSKRPLSSIETFLTDLFSLPSSSSQPTRNSTPPSSTQTSTNAPFRARTSSPYARQRQEYPGNGSPFSQRRPGYGSPSYPPEPSNPSQPPRPEEDFLPRFFQELFAQELQHQFQEHQRQASTGQTPTPTPVSSSSGPKPAAPTVNREPVPTIAEIIKNNIDISKLSVRTLKEILSNYKVSSATGMLEKSELEARVQTLIQNVRLEALQANEDLVCKVSRQIITNDCRFVATHPSTVSFWSVDIL